MVGSGRLSESSRAEDLYAPDLPIEEPVSGIPTSGLTQRVEASERLGRRKPVYDRRLFHYDKMAGMAAKPVTWHVTKDDRMEAREAGEALQRVYELFGLQNALPEELEAFNKSLFFCHTINSGSILQPGRSVLVVRGESFPFATVVHMLGADLRRFFRTFADEVRAVNREVQNQYDPYDPEKRERFEWLMEVASERGLARYADLAHDSADKCSGLTHAERIALASSKVGVFSSIINAADRIDANARTIGLDGYDSTNKTTVPARAVRGE